MLRRCRDEPEGKEPHWVGGIESEPPLGEVAVAEFHPRSVLADEVMIQVLFPTEWWEPRQPTALVGDSFGDSTDGTSN